MISVTLTLHDKKQSRKPRACKLSFIQVKILLNKIINHTLCIKASLEFKSLLFYPFNN
jgi:hypothetical protein